MESDSQIKVLIVDDHNMVVDGLVSILSQFNDLSIVGTCSNGQEAIDKTSILQPNLIIMDVDMPVLDGLRACQEIKSSSPGTKVLTLSMHNDKATIQSAIEASSDGYILKNSSSEELRKGIDTIMGGGKYFSPDVTISLINDSSELKNLNQSSELKDLTEREIEVLKLVAEGLSNKEIGEKLFISHRTVDSHRTNLMGKLDVHNVAGLIRIAIRCGLVD